MNFLKVCLKLPNLGLLAFHIIFVIIMPYIFLAYDQINILQFYWPLLISLATIFTETGKPFIFNNLYSSNPKNFIEFVSSNIINVVAVMGIIWQSLNYYTSSQHKEKSIIISAILFLVTFPLAREGTVFIIRKWDKFIRNRTDMNVKYNYHKFIIGFIYMIFLISIQVILLNLTSTSTIPHMIDINEHNTKDIYNNIDSLKQKAGKNRRNTRK